MDLKLIDAYVFIDKVFSMGIEDEEEIITLLRENCHFNYDGAVMAVASYTEDKKEIQAFIKKNKLKSQPVSLQMGE